MIFDNSSQEEQIISHWNRVVIPVTRKIKRDIKNPTLFKPAVICDILNYFQLVNQVLDTLTELVKSHEDKYFIMNFLEALKSETIKDFDAIEKLCSKHYQDAIPTIDDCRFKLLTRAGDYSLTPA